MSDNTSSESGQPAAAASSVVGPLPKLSIDQALQLAAKHHAEGQLQQAEFLLKQILQQRPAHAFALQLLSVIAHQVGKLDAAIQLMNQAITSEPTVSQFRSNIAEMYRQKGDIDAAIEQGQAAVKLNNQSAEAHSNLGIAYYDKGELDKAEACQNAALKINPTLPQALNNLGSIHRDRHEREKAAALYRKNIEHNPGYLESINNLGAVLSEDSRPEEAVEVLLSAIKHNPNYAEAHCNIASAFLSMDDLERAEVGFKRALELKPEYPEAHRGRAKLLQEQGKLVEAETVANRALGLDADAADTHVLLGSIYAESGYPEKAEAAYNRALELDLTSLSAHLGKGYLLMEMGRLDAAEACFKTALDCDPNGTSSRLAITQIRKVQPGDENMTALEEVAAKEAVGMPELKALPLHFALGKCYDDTKQYDKAFPHFLEGCRLKRKRIHYSADNNEMIAANICKFFTAETIAALRGAGDPSDLPIFVLGMPRSGTTLTEQIIASHPDVHGAGELPDLLRIAAEPQQRPTEGYPLSLQGLSKNDFTAMGSRYVAGLRERAPGAKHITDKMPANFHAIGLLHLMLPNAKIVHVKRNPVDTCLSGFTRLFSKSQHQSYDLIEMGRYYRNYATLMEHWRAVLPADAFIEVQYEDMVADKEQQARRLLDFCGLAWDDACLDFHKTERSIRTASVTQVRQPIYNTSVERWRKYEAHLGPLLDSLGDLVPTA